MFIKRFVLAVALTIAIIVPSVVAQNRGTDSPTSGFRTEFLSQLDGVQNKILDLANAIPSEKYSWRPMEGVRSISEVYMHIAGANYLFPSFIGIKAPEDIRQDMERSVTEKSSVIEVVKKSFDHIRKAVVQTPDADLDKPAKMFGRETTVRDVFFNAALHLHEHLGQSIAYARMNNIVPPWTAAEQAKEKKESKK